MCYWIDTNDRKGYYIINNPEKLHEFYKKYKNELMVGYNIKHYDQYILQGILAGFNPHDISKWIIEKNLQGWQYSQLLRKFPLLIFDTMLPTKSLKQCEASLGMKIVESSVPFDLDRKLTNQELEEVLAYCKYDVWATFEVFLQDGFYLSPQDEYSSSISIIKEFKFPPWYMSKTKAQMGVSVLGAVKRENTDDEFEISIPDNLILGQYEDVGEWFLNPENHWYSREVEGRKKPIKNELVRDVAGIPHVFAWGGVHGSVEREIVDGILLLCDFSSLYPNIMVEYNLVSRGVPNPDRYRELLHTRIKLKKQGDPREKSYKIALNGSYGQMKYERSALYDPKMANNVCVHGQLIALDLIEKIEHLGDIINSNTDGVLIRVHNEVEAKEVERICKEVSERVRIGIDIERFQRFIIKDVNNYIGIKENGKLECKGAWVKYQHQLEYDYNIVSRAIRDYFTLGIPARKTIMECSDLIEFQIIAKASYKYKEVIYGDTVIPERVNRVFASKDSNDKGIFKVHKETGSIEKIEMTPEQCFIINDDIRNMQIPSKLDKQWYIDLAERRIEEFVK